MTDKDLSSSDNSTQKACNYPQTEVGDKQGNQVQPQVNSREIPRIVVCPPTPEPTEVILEATPLTTIPNNASTPLAKQDSNEASKLSSDLQVRYGPNSSYADIKSGKYCFNCEKRHQNVCIHEVVVGLKKRDYVYCICK